MLHKQAAIAIVGGGPAGLTLGRLLQLDGFTNVKIYERDADEQARVQGAPLDLHDASGLLALDKAQLTGEFKTHYMPGADRLKIMNGRGDVCYTNHHAKDVEAFGTASFRPEIDRGVLRRILLHSLQPGTVAWQSHFTGLEKNGNGWALQFKNAAPQYADMVIAADGANSKIRRYVTAATPVYSGISMMEGTIPHAAANAPHISEMLQGGKIMAFENGQSIILGQKANDKIGFYLSFTAPEGWVRDGEPDYGNRGQLLQWFKDNYNGWTGSWEELLQATALPVTPRAIGYLPQAPWEAQPGITLMGDAAHVMPPYAGEGVNMAMLDAVKLAEALTSPEFKDTTAAIAFYENEMRSRASAAIEDSLQNGAIMHGPQALQQMLSFFNEH